MTQADGRGTERLDVERRFTANTLQQRRHSQAAQRFPDILDARRRDQQGDVSERFDIPSAVADHQHRTEGPIHFGAEHEFPAAGDHRRNHHAALEAERAQAVLKAGKGRAHFDLVVHVENDQPMIGLVRKGA